MENEIIFYIIEAILMLTVAFMIFRVIFVAIQRDRVAYKIMEEGGGAEEVRRRRRPLHKITWKITKWRLKHFVT